MITRRKQEFINYYILNPNATESAKRAGYSVKTAYSQGQRLLKTVDVKREVERLLTEKRKKYELSRDEYARETLRKHEIASNEAGRCRYWETYGRVKGYVDSQQVTQITVFKDVAQKVQDIAKRRGITKATTDKLLQPVKQHTDTDTE